MEAKNRTTTPSRIRRFTAFLSHGYSIRATGDRRRQERARLRIAHATSLWQSTRLHGALRRIRDAVFIVIILNGSLYSLLCKHRAVDLICGKTVKSLNNRLV